MSKTTSNSFEIHFYAASLSQSKKCSRSVKNTFKPQHVSSRFIKASEKFVPMITIVEKSSHLERVITPNIPCFHTHMNTSDDRIIPVTPSALQDSFFTGQNTLIIDARISSERVNGMIRGAFLVTRNKLYLRRLRKGIFTIEK